MKLIKTEDAVGHVLCHDMTQIIKGVTKDARFQQRTYRDRRGYTGSFINGKRKSICLGEE